MVRSISGSVTTHKLCCFFPPVYLHMCLMTMFLHVSGQVRDRKRASRVKSVGTRANTGSAVSVHVTCECYWIGIHNRPLPYCPTGLFSSYRTNIKTPGQEPDSPLPPIHERLAYLRPSRELLEFYRQKITQFDREHEELLQMC